MGSKNKNNKKKTKQTNDSGDPTPPVQVSKHRGVVNKETIIIDPRFASVHSDPRFQKVPQRETKVAIDARFERVFTDKRFAPSSAPVDKRGKRRKEKSSRDSLLHFYRIDGEKGGKKKRIERKDSEEAEEESEREELGKIGGQEEEEEDSRSESGGESEEEESEERGEVESSTEEEEDVVYEDGEPDLLEESIPTIEKETRRLAVVNMDWRHVRAVDLYVMLSSFLPKDGQILSVSVYPSEFGLQRMKEEEVHGPVGLFDDENEKNDGDGDGDGDGEDEDEDEDDGNEDDDDENDYDDDDVEDEVEEEDGDKENDYDDDDDEDDDEEDDDDEDDASHYDDEEIDNDKLRAYEISKLRYYFGVVECDSSATADYLYKACDGAEFERSSNVLDLRFIPDSMEFKHPPRDVAKEAPGKYEGSEFQTRALQLSKIHLSWDEDDPQRVKTLKQNFNADQLAELELKEFLASDESDTEDDENDAIVDQSEKKQKKRDMYRSLIQSGDSEDEDGENDGQDMEVTFNSGLEDLSKRLLEKKDKKSETVWEAYLRKRREKKKARKNKSKYSSEDDESSDDQEAIEQHDDFFVEEPPVKRSKKEAHRRSDREGEQRQDTKKKEAEASKAELELLLTDDEEDSDIGLKGYNLKHKKAKGKRGKEFGDEDKIPAVDYDDQRFSALFTSPLFALDPTDPQFKRSAAYVRQVSQRQQKGDKQELVRREPMKLPTKAQLPSDDAETSKDEHTKSEVLTSKKEKHELSSLVKSLKMKSRQVQLTASKKDNEMQTRGVGQKKQELSSLVLSAKKKKTKVRK